MSLTPGYFGDIL